MAKKMGKDDNMDWKDEIDVLLRSGPQGDVPGNLAWLRKSVLCDGLVADTDGMVYSHTLLRLDSGVLDSCTY